ncbi:MAG: DUF3419 family protein [Tenericutes bacterium]|nr:DUF3419 family protein [Mycoplasmatota bacterium]
MNKYEKLLYKENENSLITPFGCTESSYLWTNENMYLYDNEDLKDKKVLTVTSSGDHALNAILNGAKNIDSFDINLYSKYVSALKIAMIKKYDYNAFYYRVNWIENIGGLNFNAKENMVEELKEYLTYDEYMFWKTEEYLRINNKICFYDIVNTNLYRNLNKYNNVYSYKKLRRMLGDVSIIYNDFDIKDISDNINNKYDCIYVSNILEFFLSSDKEYKKVVQSLDGILNKRGKIHGYDFNWNMNAKYIDKYPNNLDYKYSETKDKKCSEKVFVLQKIK